MTSTIKCRFMNDQYKKQHISEAMWVAQLKEGNERAFRKIYDLYHHKLYYYSLRFTHSGEAAKELVQEVFVKLWMVRENLNPDLSLQSYLYTLARHLNFKYLQKAASDSELREEIMHHYTAHYINTEDEFVYAEYLKIAEKAVEQLPPHRRLIFKMSRYEGLSYKEIAGNLGISINTVKNHLVKANKCIKKYLLVHTDIPVGILILITFCLF